MARTLFGRPFSRSDRGTYFPVLTNDKELLCRVEFTTTPGYGPYREVAPGIFVSDFVLTEFDYPLPKGWYTVTFPLSPQIQITGESLDLAFLAASRGVSGFFSADVNRDLSISPVVGIERKLALARRLGRWDVHVV